MKKFDGKKFKKIRIEKGITQEELSKGTEEGPVFVHEKTISHWEICDEANPRRKNLEAVARVLDTRVEEFFIEDQLDEEKGESKERVKKNISLTDAELINEVVKLAIEPSYKGKKQVLEEIRNLIIEKVL